MKEVCSTFPCVFHDGTLYAYSAVSELEQTAAGLLGQRWVLRVNLADGSTGILSQIEDEDILFGPIGDLDVDPQGVV